MKNTQSLARGVISRAFAVNLYQPSASGIAVPDVPSFSGQQVHTYLALISLDGRDIASNIFTGN